MVAPRVPGQLANETMILVEVVSSVREDDVGIDAAFSSSKTSLTSPPTYGKKPSRNPCTTTFGPPRRLEEDARRSPAPRLPLVLRAEHDPRHLELRVRPRERQQRRAATDLDVVGVRAEKEDVAASPDDWRFDYRNSYAYRDANYGYTGFYVNQDQYNYYFRQGFQKGYEDGYYSRSQYGQNVGNGKYQLIAGLLSTLLNLTSIR